MRRNRSDLSIPEKPPLRPLYFETNTAGQGVKQKGSGQRVAERSCHHRINHGATASAAPAVAIPTTVSVK
jgi:hypothetical protein